MQQRGRLGRLLRSSSARRSLGALLALLVFTSVAAGAFTYFRDQLANNLNWSRGVNVERETRVVNRLFDLAKEHRLIALRRESDGRLLITPPPCEQTMLEPPSEPGAADRRAALTLFCSSPQGEEIRDEIEAWNTSFDFLAVRDNRSQNDSCGRADKTGEASKLKVDMFVPYGCKPNEWDLARLIEKGQVAAAWLPRAEPPPSQYDFIIDTQDPMAYAGDWARVSPDPATDGARIATRYQLTSKEMPIPGSGVVTINLIGRLRTVTINGDTLAIKVNEPDIDKWKRVGNVYVRLWLVCHEDDLDDPDGSNNDGEEDEGNGSEAVDCTAEPGAEDQVRFAYQVDIAQVASGIPARGRVQPAKINIALEAETNTYLPKRLRDGDARGAILRLTRHLRVACRGDWLKAPNPTAECALDWLRFGGSENKIEHAKHRIVIGTGAKAEDLIDPKTGVILPAAFQRGYMSIVGLGPQDWGSLTAALAARPSANPPMRTAANTKGAPKPAPDAEPEPEVFPLTIDPRIQKLAFDTIYGQHVCRSRRSTKDGSLPDCGTRKLADKRTATLVVLDADQKPGDILALASVPTPPRRLHVWDLSAIEDGEYGHAGLGWRAVTGDNVPGSTFKTLTAISAITAATAPETNPEFAKQLRGVLEGGLPLRQQIDFLHLAYAPPSATSAGPRGSKRPRIGACVVQRDARPESVNAVPAPNATSPQYCGRNFGFRSNPSARYWNPTDPGSSRCPRYAQGVQLGMCEALIASSNLYYGGVAQRLFQMPGADTIEPLTLRTAHRLSFGRNVVPRGLPTPPDIKDVLRGFDLTRGKAPTSALLADPVNMRAAIPGEASKNAGSVVRSGFGDDVSATPLAIATIYASVATGKVVRPTIVPLERAQGCPVTKADDEECNPLLAQGRNAEPLMEVLRAGLRGVGRTGPFRQLAELANEGRLHVKTGTATVSRGRRFSTWVAGWVDGKAGSNIPSRVSFACFFTHRSDADLGGRVCGPVISEFLLKLMQTPL